MKLYKAKLGDEIYDVIVTTNLEEVASAYFQGKYGLGLEITELDISTLTPVQAHTVVTTKEIDSNYMDLLNNRHGRSNDFGRIIVNE